MMSVGMVALKQKNVGWVQPIMRRFQYGIMLSQTKSRWVAPILRELDSETQESPTAALDAPQQAAQLLLEKIQLHLTFEEGEVTMFIMDIPDVPPDRAPVMLMQTSSSQGASKPARTIGVCNLVENSQVKETTANNVFSPAYAVGYYFKKIEGKDVGFKGIVTS